MNVRELATRFKALAKRKLRQDSKDRQLKLLRERLAEKNRRLKLAHERALERNRTIEQLRTELLDTRNAFHQQDVSERIPVFFIVGRAKSGTSWLMRILDSHPEILCRGEGRFFGLGFKREDFKQAQIKNIQPSSLYRAILDAEYLKAWVERSVWTRGEDVDRHLANLTHLATRYFLTQKLAGTGKKIVGDKTPLLDSGVVSEISEVYPQAKVIHIIRDGRDAAISMSHHRWNHAKSENGIYDLKPEELAKREAYRSNPQTLSEQGIFPERMLRGMAASWREQVSRSREDGLTHLGENYTEVRYEDLLENPEEEVGRLLRFLGADAGEDVVRYCVSSAAFEKWSGGRQRGQEDSSAFLRKGVAGDWKDVFTRKDREIFKEEAGDLLVELGYEEHDQW